MAPELLSDKGRVLTLMLWAILIAFSLIGATHMDMNFSMDYFLLPDEPVTKFIHLNNKYFAEGF